MIKTTHMRGANQVAQHTTLRKTSADGKRTALGRYVKRSIGNRRYDIVLAWTLKERDASGKIVTAEVHRSEDDARQWVGETN